MSLFRRIICLFVRIVSTDFTTTHKIVLYFLTDFTTFYLICFIRKI